MSLSHSIAECVDDSVDSVASLRDFDGNIRERLPESIHNKTWFTLFPQITD